VPAARMNVIEFGDCRETMRKWVAQGIKVQMCVTSPPYYQLRDYGVDGQIGLEPTPDDFIEQMVEVFRCVRDLIADDGVLWVNIGDSYAKKPYAPWGVKIKDELGIPDALANALRSDGWYRRQTIIWSKPNPMTESVSDRCTKSHEYLYLFSKSSRYFYDQEAVKEPVSASSIARLAQDVANQRGSDRIPGKTNGPMKAVRSKRNSFRRENSKRAEVFPGQSMGTHRPERPESEYALDTRNRRSVWTIATRPYKGAHFATFPPALIEPCILAGSRVGDIVLDPFMGSGTTAAVAVQHGRQYVGCDLNPEYGPLQEKRIEETRAAMEKALLQTIKRNSSVRRSESRPVEVSPQLALFERAAA
jgi:DNA modification methylase